MRSCTCGKPIKSESATNVRFWDEEYCSRYCREYDERGLEMVNRADMLKEKGSKHYKNFSGIWSYPSIKAKCICCGEETVTLTKTNDQDKPYCSRTCHNRIHRMPKARKSQIVFTMLRVMKHRYLNYEGSEQWLSGSAMYNIMQKMGGHPFKNGYPMIMKIWAGRGLLLKRDSNYRNEEGQSRKEVIYCFNPAHLDKPLGKAFYECAGVSWE